jgi:hypothetical protein
MVKGTEPSCTCLKVNSLATKSLATESAKDTDTLVEYSVSSVAIYKIFPLIKRLSVQYPYSPGFLSA